MAEIDNTFTTTILSGQQLSGAIDLKTFTICGLFMPAALTGTTITFFASQTLAGTYIEVDDGSGSAVSVTVAASRFIPVNPLNFIGIQFLKIKSGSAEGADRIIGLSGRDL